MVCLVTGGAGFIGSHLVERLISDSFEVIVLDNLSTGKKENLPYSSSLKFIHADINDTSSYEHLKDDIEYIFHLAALVSVDLSIQNPALSKKINIDGSFNILEFAKNCSKLKNLFFASSAAVYGIPETLPIHESDNKLPISPYGLEKLVIEQYLDIYHKIYGIPWVVGRFFNVYGERQDPKSPYSGVISIFLDRKKSIQPITIFGDGSNTRDFIYVKDVIDNIFDLTVKHNIRNSIFNIGTGSAITISELAELVQKLSDDIIPINYVSARIGDITESTADISSLYNVIKSKNRLISVELLENIFLRDI